MVRRSSDVGVCARCLTLKHRDRACTRCGSLRNQPAIVVRPVADRKPA